MTKGTWLTPVREGHAVRLRPRPVSRAPAARRRRPPCRCAGGAAGCEWDGRAGPSVLGGNIQSRAADVRVADRGPVRGLAGPPAMQAGLQDPIGRPAGRAADLRRPETGSFHGTAAIVPAKSRPGEQLAPIRCHWNGRQTFPADSRVTVGSDSVETLIRPFLACGHPLAPAARSGARATSAAGTLGGTVSTPSSERDARAARQARSPCRSEPRAPPHQPRSPPYPIRPRPVPALRPHGESRAVPAAGTGPTDPTLRQQARPRSRRRRSAVPQTQSAAPEGGASLSRPACGSGCGGRPLALLVQRVELLGDEEG